jgi:predicted nuclease with RNAse H fold
MNDSEAKALKAVKSAFEKKYEKQINRGKKKVKKEVEKTVGKPTLEALGYTSMAMKALTEKSIKLKKRFGNVGVEVEHSPYETKASLNYNIDF